MTAPSWRELLTESERIELIGIDAEITMARESDRRHTATREKIRRRCVARGQRNKGGGMMADVSRTVHLDDLSPKELALLVADLTCDDLADFFNELGWMKDASDMRGVRSSLDGDAIWLAEAMLDDVSK